MHLRVATRMSKLALIQTNEAIAQLKANIPNLTFELVKMETIGDKIQDKPLAAIGGKGLFIKGLEIQLINGNVDFAVHSLKDVPPILENEFCIPAVLKRESPQDALISQKYDSISNLPNGAIVGTSSVRRQTALLNIRPDLEIRMLRGNVDTRIKKLYEGKFDAIILAVAGLKRLGLEKEIKEILPVETFTPSVGQGVIAIECLKMRDDIIELLTRVNDSETYARITAERSMNRLLNASCTSAIGSYATILSDSLHLHGVIWSRDGKQRIETHQSGSLNDADQIGQAAAKDLIKKGGLQILDSF